MVPAVPPLTIVPLIQTGSSALLPAMSHDVTQHQMLACAVAHSKSDAEILHVAQTGAVTANFQSAAVAAFPLISTRNTHVSFAQTLKTSALSFTRVVVAFV